MQTNRESTANPGRDSEERTALAILAEDHEKVRQLSEEYQALLESGDEAAADLVQQICRELEIHTALEEEILYPAAAKLVELALLIDQAREDHDRVKEIVDEIRSMDANDPQIPALVLQLAEDVETHVGEEEAVLFPELEQRMQDQLAQLGRQMELLRRRIREI